MDEKDTSLPEKREDKLEQLLADLPDEKKQEITEYLFVHQGPLPTTEAFREYNQIVPGAALRILEMAEKEQEIRATDTRAFRANERVIIFGAILFGVLLLIVAGGAVYMGYTGVAIIFGIIAPILSFARFILRWIVSRNTP